MAKQINLYLPAGFVSAAVTIVPADTTAWKTVYTAATNDAVVKSLACVSNDTAAKIVRVGIDIGGTVFQIGAVNIPIASGTNGIAAAVDLLQASQLPFLALDRSGKRILPLKAGNILKVAAVATVTENKTLTVTALAEEY